MVIGIDLHEAAPGLRPTGTGRVARELARHLPAEMPADEFVFYSREGFPLGEEDNVRWEVCGRRDPSWHYEIGRHANRHADVFLSPTSFLPSQFLRIPYVQVVHDLVNRHWSATAKRRAVLVDRFTMRRAVHRAAGILTPSKAVRDELLEEFPNSPPATVMPEAADPMFHRYPEDEVSDVLRRYRISGDYVLCTGTIEPRKNLLRTVRAYERLPAALRARYALVLAGRLGWRAGPIVSAMSESPSSETIRHLSFVPDEDLPKLYSGATALCYASLYEGFGLPLLEAMQSGTPVITSNRSSLPEVAGPAAHYVDPESEVSISEALSALLSDDSERASLREAGLLRASEFSWDRTAELVAESIREAAGGPTTRDGSD
ncbi:MAG: glycosyltransferase family 1 protein [Solirubrobacterales bacterium]